jgi:hypothetical protein
VCDQFLEGFFLCCHISYRSKSFECF